MIAFKPILFFIPNFGFQLNVHHANKREYYYSQYVTMPEFYAYQWLVDHDAVYEQINFQPATTLLRNLSMLRRCCCAWWSY